MFLLASSFGKIRLYISVFVGFPLGEAKVSWWASCPTPLAPCAEGFHEVEGFHRVKLHETTASTVDNLSIGWLLGVRAMGSVTGQVAPWGGGQGTTVLLCSRALMWRGELVPVEWLCKFPTPHTTAGGEDRSAPGTDRPVFFW